MKNKFILSVYLILSLKIVSQQSPFLEQSSSKKMFSGTIEFPIKTNFNLCLFYKGEKLFTETHSPMPWIEYSFYDVPETHSIYIVITDQVAHATQAANTLQTLKIYQNNHYICYKLQAKRSVMEDEYTVLTWEIFDHKLTDNIIPENSLIFLFNPELIAGLKLQSWKAENIFRVIPTILIKPDASLSEIERALNVAQLAALDVKSIHAQNPSTVASTIISTPKNI